MCAKVWTRGLIAGILIGIGCLAAPGAQATDAEHSGSAEGKIHLGTGAIDTATLPNLLSAPRLPEGRDLLLQLRENITPETRRKLERAGVVNEIIHFADGRETLDFFLRKGSGSARI